MSFILDALKKSEIERQRQAVPGLMDSRPAAPRARFPLWGVALVVLLAVNLGVLAVVLIRGGSPASHGDHPADRAEPAQPAAAASPGAAPPLTAAARDGHFSPMDPAPTYAPEIPAAERPPANPPVAPAGASHRATRMPDPVLTHDDDKADSEVLPSISEINLTGPQALPELHLDVHVFATKPGERFVYINMRKYREGATLEEGPVLERIRRDGVVLDFHGLRFLLPRQQ